jgi:dienelactone hydrolase
MNWKSILIILVVVVLFVAAFLTKPVQVGIRADTLFVDMGLNYKWHVTVPRNISISEVTYPCGDRTVVANLYQPHDHSRHSGIILAHGAVKDGKDDQALVLAAQSLARAGYVALVPQLENLRTFRLHTDDIETLVASFQYLWQQKFVNGKIGMVGICLSAPMVLLAATDGRISDDVTVISSWGGYYNINDWLQAVITEQYFDQGQAVSWKPRPTLKAAVSRWFIEFLPDASEREVIEEMPLEKLTPEVQQTLNNLSPHSKVGQLKTKIAIIHTATDDVIPWVESVKLAEAIPDDQKVYFKIFHRFYHTDIKQLLSTRLSQFADTVSEATGFYLYIYSILYQL